MHEAGGNTLLEGATVNPLLKHPETHYRGHHAGNLTGRGQR